MAGLSVGETGDKSGFPSLPFITKSPWEGILWRFPDILRKSQKTMTHPLSWALEYQHPDVNLQISMENKGTA